MTLLSWQKGCWSEGRSLSGELQNLNGGWATLWRRIVHCGGSLACQNQQQQQQLQAKHLQMALGIAAEG
jgi:hypothetical protein